MLISGLDECMVIGDIAIVYCLQQVMFKSQKARLSADEYAVLCTLAAHRGTALSNRQICLSAWGDVAKQRGMARFIRNLRMQIDPDRRYITSVWRKGYKLVIPKSDTERSNSPVAENAVVSAEQFSF